MATKKKRKKPVSQKDVAKAAGVSQPVVSAALNGSNSVGVSEATLRRVRIIAEELGYRINHRAGAAAESKTVVLIQNSREIGKSSEWIPFSYTLFYMRYVDGLLSALQGTGHHLTIKYPERWEDFVADLDAIQPVALIWPGRTNISDEKLLELCERYPLVGIRATAPLGIHTVDVDQERLVAIACDHLMRLGHHRIAYVGGKFGHARIRHRAMEQYMEDHQLPPPRDTVVEATPLQSKGALILDEWEAMGPDRPTALLMADFYAGKVLDEAHRRGLEVPGAFSLVGIDNTPDCELYKPRLTSVEQPLEAVCQTAVDMALKPDLHNFRQCSSIRLEPSLVVRESCGPPPFP